MQFLYAFLLCLLFSPSVLAQHHEGFGSQTPGGAGGEIVHVTNLSDRDPGSLRECIMGSHRICVFDVGGTIKAEHELGVLGEFLTIDGSTAPPPGITITGWGFKIEGFPRYLSGAHAHDVIIKDLRCRAVEGDCVGVGWSAYNIVLDHLSTHGAKDAGIDVTHGAHDVTVQYSIVNSLLGKNSLLKSMFTPGDQEVREETKRISYHHNLVTAPLASSTRSERNPRVSNVKDGSRLATEVTADIRNNIIANWGQGHGTDVECGGKANIVNNLYTSPNSQGSDLAQNIELRPDGYNCFDGGANRYGGYAYVAGNRTYKGEVVTVYDDPTRNSDPGHAQAEPYAAASVTTTEACGNAHELLKTVGSRNGGLDAIDQKYLSEVTIPVDCSSTEPPPKKYSCTIGSAPHCIEDPAGPFASFGTCIVQCGGAPTPDLCEGVSCPDGQKCNDKTGLCVVIPPKRYKCQANGTCKEDKAGTFMSSDDCKDACEAPPPPAGHKFRKDDQVMALDLAVVHVSADGNSRVVGMQLAGATGRVVRGPNTSQHIMFYRVAFADGTRGWVIEGVLGKAGSTMW